MFEERIVAAITSHMNVDHVEDTLTICRGSGLPDAISARMIGFDTRGADFEVDRPTGKVTHRVPWTHEITERAEVREQLVALVERFSGTTSH